MSHWPAIDDTGHSRRGRPHRQDAAGHRLTAHWVVGSFGQPVWACWILTFVPGLLMLRLSYRDGNGFLMPIQARRKQYGLAIALVRRQREQCEFK